MRMDAVQKMIDAAKEYIRSHSGNKTLFVIKGMDISAFGVPIAQLDELISNKFQYFMEMEKAGQTVVSYSVFVAIYDFLLAQYDHILILENPLFRNLYPLDVQISEESKKNLFNHFDPDAKDEAEIGQNIGNYTDIYSNFLRTDQGIACSYNITDVQLNDIKIEEVTVWTPFSRNISTEEDASSIVKAITVESDYFEVVQKVLQGEYPLCVDWESYEGGKDIAGAWLAELNAYIPDSIFALPRKKTIHHTLAPEVYGMMEKYWGFNQFRNFKTYDLESLDHKKKKITEASQGDVVSDIISQVENCIEHKPARDVFVTAPTGSGKSLMFQLPAMYLADKYNTVTLVITPLIGLMQDQVDALKRKHYTFAETINSDISPIKKNEILERVKNGECHILYLSPETLLSRSDIEQLIGSRRIGLLVVDEAHIVTTWGKQFRPDYWFLGDYVQKLRSRQAKEDSSFIIATFTATAIYGGHEDMYHETLNSLHMFDPITYLGYVRRDNIEIDVKEVPKITARAEYELNKFDDLLMIIRTALLHGEKVLIYFPTVALINRFKGYYESQNMEKYITIFHGQLRAEEKEENVKAFRTGQKKVMAATKAFGMGIDIPDIATVVHFAPTGNVCDYLQEIGRAARDESIQGHAVYHHMNNDFKYINQLYGLSSLKKYQLTEVIKKIFEIYRKHRNSAWKDPTCFTRKRNAMLVDADSFAYIFEGYGNTDMDNMINKVKTAMLLIQKDYERMGFSPFNMRPIPLFATGFFSIPADDQKELDHLYHGVVRELDKGQHICEVKLDAIWNRSYKEKYSFPKFKYLLYSKADELKLNGQVKMTPALQINVQFEKNGNERYLQIIRSLQDIVRKFMNSNVFADKKEMVSILSNRTGLSIFTANNIVEIFLAAGQTYAQKYTKFMNGGIFRVRRTGGNKETYKFLPLIRNYFGWIFEQYKNITNRVRNGEMYVINEPGSNQADQVLTALGILETFGVLRFKSLGGANSQLYIYVNSTKIMQMVGEKPESYHNRLLDLIGERHEEAVKMMTYMFESNFDSNTIWDILENYFIGILPEGVLEEK